MKKKPSKAKKVESKKERAAKWKNQKLLAPDNPAPEAKMVRAEVMLTAAAAEKLQAGIKEDILGAEAKITDAAIKIDAFVRGEGWKALGYKGLTEWRDAEMPFSTFYNARSAMKLLAAGVPPERIQKMSLTNMNELTRKLPASKWTDEKTLDAACGPIAAFEKLASKKSEEIGMHVEEEIPRGFKIPKSVADNWDKALRVAQVIDHCGPMEQRIEIIIATYLNSPSSEEGKSRLQLYSENIEETL